MNIQRFIPVLLIALTVSSCTSIQTFMVDDQAKVKLPENVQRIGIVNNILVLNKEREDLTTVERRQRDRIQNASNMATNGAFNSIIRHSGRTKILSNDSIRNNYLGLDWHIIDSIAQQDSIDVLIEFTQFETTMTIGTVVLSKMVNVPASQKLKGSLLVNFYDVKARKIIAELPVKNEIDVAVSGDLVNMEMDMRRKDAAFEQIGYNLGFAGSELMYTQQLELKRVYYTSGSPTVVASKRMMERRNWTAAEAILLQNIDDGKHKVRGRALYNLAVVKEAQGDLVKAIEYAERSAFECMNARAKSYLNELELRRGVPE